MDAKNLPAAVTRVLLITAAAAMVLSGAAFAEVQYTVTELEAPGQESSWGMAVNEGGQVLFSSWGIDGPGSRYFLWDPQSGIRDLSSSLEDGADLTDLNDDSDFTVWMQCPPTYEDRAYLWDGEGTPQQLGVFYPVGLNNAGRVIGHTHTYDSGGIVWDGEGGVREIGALPGGTWTSPHDINNAGQVAGVADSGIPLIGHPITVHSLKGSPGVQNHAFLWDDDQGILDLATLGGDYAWAAGINDIGQVVGTSYTGNGDEYRAFLWNEEAGMQDIGALAGEDNSEAYAINNDGRIVGESGGRAFIWDPIDGMQAIADLLASEIEWANFHPYDINNSGQIVGYRVIRWGFDEETHEWEFYEMKAALLTPIPEPAASSLLLTGMLGLIFQKRVNRNGRLGHIRRYALATDILRHDRRET